MASHAGERLEPLKEKHRTARGRMAISVPQIASYRLLETIAQNLEMQSERLPTPLPELKNLREYELIVAEESVARAIHQRMAELDRERGEFGPAVVAVRSQENASSSTAIALPLEDGIIQLPQDPAIVLAQISVVLYAHRAFTFRYESSMQELNLNRSIFRSVSTGITVASATLPDTPLVYVNPAFEMMTGYPLEECIGRNCRFLQGQEHDQPGLTVLREAMADEKQVTVVVRNYRKNGSSFWNEVSIAPIRSREGAITHYVGVQNDVTARIEFESALRESEKLAAVGRLAASIAHEINNPLESVMNLLFLALHSQSREEAQDYVAQADAEVKRVALITTQSLRFYKQNSNPQPMQVQEIMESVLALYDTKLRRFSIHVVRTYQPAPEVMCLESEMRQVVSNLIRNAIDSMRPHGGRMRVAIRPTTNWRTGQKGVGICIGDEGGGIPEESLRKIYNAFYTTKGETGTGLGLWVTSNIVDRRGGAISVHTSTSPQRHGTVFRVFFPTEDARAQK